MTTTPADQFITAFDNALANMAPGDREYAMRQYTDDMRALLEHLNGMPPDERRALLDDIRAECREAVADIAGAGPAELRRFATESAHTLRVRGEHHPGLNDDETARVEAALEIGQRYHKAFRACRHVLAGGPVIARAGAALCITHPQQGVRCQDCHNTHALTHDPVEERTCDNCRTVVAEIFPVICFGPTAFRVALPKKRSRWVPAMLTVLGTGYCGPCRRERGDDIPDVDQVAPHSWRTETR
jgi:Zn finger protein HypA/HybF involved in hydrogenase expression